MKPVQWLLVGGAHHGKIVEAKPLPRVVCEGVEYEGYPHFFKGEVFHIGYASVSDMDPDVVRRLICELRPQPMAEDEELTV